MKVGSMFFSDIRIIQSLEDGERKTGTELFETLRYYPLKLGNEKLDVLLDDIKTYDDLKSIFADIRERIKNQNRIPIIHFEIHGDENKSGLILSSGDFIPWGDVVKYLVEINILTRNSLIVVMGVCFGSYIGLDALTRTFSFPPKLPHEGRSAFTWMIASSESVTDRQIYEAFIDFYDNLMSDNFDPATLRINQVPGLFSISAMETFANYLIAGIKWRIQSPAFKVDSKNALNRIMVINPAALPRRPYHLQLEAFNKKRAAYYKDQLKQMRDRYLMIDLFPENNKRFESFDKAWKTQLPKYIDISLIFPSE